MSSCASICFSSYCLDPLLSLLTYSHFFHSDVFSTSFFVSFFFIKTDDDNDDDYDDDDEAGFGFGFSSSCTESEGLFMTAFPPLSMFASLLFSIFFFFFFFDFIPPFLLL
jgi:hypothetical protein